MRKKRHHLFVFFLIALLPIGCAPPAREAALPLQVQPDGKVQCNGSKFELDDLTTLLTERVRERGNAWAAKLGAEEAVPFSLVYDTIVAVANAGLYRLEFTPAGDTQQTAAGLAVMLPTPRSTDFDSYDIRVVVTSDGYKLASGTVSEQEAAQPLPGSTLDELSSAITKAAVGHSGFRMYLVVAGFDGSYGDFFALLGVLHATGPREIELDSPCPNEKEGM